MKALLKVLIVWVTLLGVPLQGFASATMPLCASAPAVAQHDLDHAPMVGSSGAHAHTHARHAGPDMQAGRHPSVHHHTAKCAACATCGSCVSMAPSFIALVPASASPASIFVPFEQRILPSAELALPERPPRA